MSYGTLKVDNLTYTSASVDTSVTVSGLVQGQFPNITITGTISGATITGNTVNATTITAVTGIFTSTLSGATTTGITANFQSGVFTTQVSGATIAGPTHTGTTANFQSGVFTTQVSGATVIGPTHTGTTANFVSGVFTTNLSGATVTGNSGQFTNVTGDGAGFTSVTGTTVTGTTANFVSGVFTTQISGSIVAGPTHTGTTANFASGNFTGTLSGTTTRDTIGNVRDIPQNSQTVAYTLVAGDAGKHVFTTSGVTIPSGVFSVGQAVSIYNNTTGTITVTQGTNVTLRQAGTSGGGDRTLAQRGLATVLCVSGVAGTEFVIAGNIT